MKMVLNLSSKTKTVCMHFCNKRKLHPDPTLTIFNSQIPVVSQTKFLGVIFDSKLNFKAHIDYIRQKCEKSHELTESSCQNGLGSR